MTTISRRAVRSLPLLACGPHEPGARGGPPGPEGEHPLRHDDHAAHAIGCYGSRVNRTPHLDRLANEGLRMDRVFATNSICTPSRASILTGTYRHMNGVPVFNRFDGSQPTVQRMLHPIPAR